MLRIALALVALQAPSAPVITVRPDTVTVAEPFTVTVAVRSAAAATVTFPPGPDSAQAVEAVDPPVVRTLTDSAGLVHVASYRLVAWETGAQPVALAAIAIDEGSGVRRVNVTPTVFVRSVLPADSAKRTPRPALNVLFAPFPWWISALGALLALAVIAVFWLRHRRRPPAPPPSPYALAERALAGVETLGLLDAGEPSRFVALHVEVLRDYLSARSPAASRALTTSELAESLAGRGSAGERTVALLREVEQIQFARRTVTAARAQEVAREVRALLGAFEEAFARVAASRGAVSPSSPKRVA